RTRTRPRSLSTLFPYTTLFRSAFDFDEVELAVLKGTAGELSGLRQPCAQACAEPQDGTNPCRRTMHLQFGAILASEAVWRRKIGDRKSTRLNSSHVKISYAVFC